MSLDTPCPDAVTLATDLCVLRLRGRDVQSYLHTKLTVDTRPWRERGGSYGFATDVNGRIVFDGHFVVVDDEVRAIVAALVREEAITHLDKWVIMEDVQITDASAEYAIGLGIGRSVHDVLLAATPADQVAPGGSGIVFDATPDQTPAQWAVLAGHRLCWWSWQQAGQTRTAWWTSPAEAEAVIAAFASQAGLPILSADAWQDLEVACGQARLGRELVPGHTIPLEAGAWHGVEFNKGCYLGQEVIERLFSKGRPARRLWQVRWADAPVADGHALVNDAGEEVGTITHSARDAQGSVALAWIRRQAIDNNDVLRLAEQHTEVTRVALIGGDAPPDSRIRPRGVPRGR